ncbi:glycosyltransferase 87 family protein [Salinibacterium sp. SYSU T00001]|uniref:glycosyltransferase 87 family protein n=1 Tax=Homoserinimonas sedimenticola TaxID=2986805 RepID=UPI0022355522|nr:glycosyltransferase 87 family protein [Salinibacterium sedimenticola]MCW4386616.1 glycosyltransferase 87 family protein [Salinibacterium sedimenticola]
MSRRGSARTWLWCAFLAANLWVAWLAYTGPGYPLGDVYLYRWWVELGLEGGPWVGIDTSWVYPVLALAPMVLPAVGGELYPLAWLVLVGILNVLALLTLVGVRGRPRSLAAGWWWTAFLIALGPIAVGRIDSVTVPLAIIGLVFLAQRPFVAGALLAGATWMKVWPAALIAAVLVVARSRWSVLLGVVTTTAFVMTASVLLGGAAALFSFVSTQSDRGLQIEAPASAPWLWRAAAGDTASGLYYDDSILTYQVFGPGVDLLARIMTPLLAAAAVALVTIAVWLQGRGVRSEALLPPFALALVTTLIAVNKVGSPQFVTWLATVVVFGIVASRSGGPSFRGPAVLTLVIALLTQLVYPVLYGYLLSLEPVMLVILTLRNALYFVLLGWSVRAMLRAPRGRRRA